MKWSWNERDRECWAHGTFDTKEEAIEDAYGCKEMKNLSSLMEEFHEGVGMKPNWFRIVNMESFVLH